ncbi:hypothetical protein DPEC_G00223030, partial [Dallia pectoralis]
QQSERERDWEERRERMCVSSVCPSMHTTTTSSSSPSCVSLPGQPYRVCGHCTALRGGNSPQDGLLMHGASVSLHLIPPSPRTVNLLDVS